MYSDLKEAIKAQEVEPEVTLTPKQQNKLKIQEAAIKIADAKSESENKIKTAKEDAEKQIKEAKAKAQMAQDEAKKE